MPSDSPRAGPDADDAPAAGDARPPAAGPASSRGADPVEWRGESHARLRRFVKHAGAGFLGGTLLLVLALLGFVIVSSVGSGGSDALLLLVVLALVGGPFSLLYLAAAAGVGGRERLLELVPGANDLRARWVALASVPGAAAAGLGVVHPPLLLASLLGLLSLWAVGDAGRAAGSLDPSTGTLTVRRGERRREADVRGLRTVQVHRVGATAVFRLGYEGRDRLTAPRVVVVPGDAADAARAGFEAVCDTEWPGYDPPRASRAARVVLAGFGGLFLFVGVATAVVVSGASAGFAAYVAAFFGLFGGLFLLYALLG